MLKALVIIGAVLVIAVIAVVAYAATQPDNFRVQRSTTINAPAEKIHAILTDLRRGIEWSPYEKKDPNMKRSFSGPVTGVGSALAWDGNKDIGAGTLKIADATPSKIVVNLDMTKPMEAHNIVEYTLAPAGNATNVTWSMHGPMNMISKVMCVFVNMDRMVGNDFEQGLRNLKALAEK